MRLARVRIDREIFAAQIERTPQGEDIATVLDIAGTDPVLALIQRAAQARDRLEDVAVGARTDQAVPLGAVRVLAPIARPGKIIAVGLNYPDHTAETKLDAPKVPLTFAKYATSITGPSDNIRVPRSQTQQVDYEAELAAVIGLACKPDGTASISAVVAYTAVNDISARDVQFSDSQWTRGKSFDTFAPLGPWLVTADEIGDISDLRIRAIVNGETVQDDVAGSMVFDLATILQHVSDGTSLEPGDVILTGTPAGAGAFRNPPRFLRDGDTVEVLIDRIGTLRNVIQDV